MQVADIQRFCMHDGPGIRTTIFLKGCPLRCDWCHNPETQNIKSELLYYKNKCIGCGACAVCPQELHNFSNFHIFNRNLCVGCGKCATECPTCALEIVGKDYTIQELFENIEKDFVFYGESGGVTISGGEPFMQQEDTISLLKLCKEKGINTTVETCGYFNYDILKEAIPVIDLFLWDIKDTDSKRHKNHTGVTNEQIINNLIVADSMGAKTLIRCILVNGVNTNEEHYKNVFEIVSKLSNCEGIEFMPYHAFGGGKTEALGKEISNNNNWIPTENQIAEAKNYFLHRKIRVI